MHTSSKYGRVAIILSLIGTESFLKPLPVKNSLIYFQTFFEEKDKDSGQTWLFFSD